MSKKCLFLFIMVNFILSFSHLSYCAPAYGTHMPSEGHWSWGEEASFIIDRNLNNDEGGSNGSRYFLTGSYGIFRWLSLDVKAGLGNVEWDSRSNNNDISYSTNFAGGYGFRIRVYERGSRGIKSVVGFQHISVHPEAKNQDGDKNEAIVDEWQGSLLISKNIRDFIPYLGARYGTFDFIKKTNEHDRKRIKSEENYGIIIGLDYRLNERMKMNLEGIFLDGEEFTIGVSYDF